MPILPALPMFSVRIEDFQLSELSSRAKKQPAKQGLLRKVDLKGKKSSEKWCCVYQNFLFYYETVTSPKPSGVVLLEGCLCTSATVDLPECTSRDKESGFSIRYNKDSLQKQVLFLTGSISERDEWIIAINNSSMSRLQSELQSLRLQCQQLESKVSAADTEIVHLKQQHAEAQEDIASLRATLALPRRKPSLSSSSSVTRTPSPEDKNLTIRHENARIIQSYIRGWLIRRRWKRLVHSYTNSPHANMMKKRNQLIWKFVASEEDYVNQLSVLRGEFQQQCEIAACSLKPPLSLEQCVDIFRNCDQLLLFHQLYLRGLHSRVEKWPVVNLGDVLKLFTPMLAVYHQYIGNQPHTLDVLFALKLRPQFKDFLECLEKKQSCKGMTLEDLLMTPLNRILGYITDLQELKAYTPAEHVDYTSICDSISELEMIQKIVTDEVCFNESIRQVLSVERKIEGGCEHLLDKEQTLIRKGFLHIYRNDDKGVTVSRKTRKQCSYCFLFSKHFIIAQRIEKKGEEVYRIQKDAGILPLAKCRIRENSQPIITDSSDLRFLEFSIECENDNGKQDFLIMALGTSEKAQWIADIAQCIENEKQNKILESQCQGEPVELSSKFIRYSTFKTGKEQLVNCGTLDSLLSRLVKVSYFGLDFLNTFLMTFPIFTNSHTVMDFLIKNYQEIMEKRIRRSTLSTRSPEECVKDARSYSSSVRSTPTCRTSPILPKRQLSQSLNENPCSISGIFFALKHWICKHFYHFQTCLELDAKLQELLDTACQSTHLSASEKRIVLDVSSLYTIQKKGESDSQCPIIKYLTEKESVPPHPFDIVLSWQPRQVAEQLCLIDSALFCRIGNDELLRYLHYKGDNKVDVAPNIVAIIQYFNQMSVYWMWAVAKQHSDVERTQVIELLIQIGSECSQLNNFMGMMQIVGALENSCVLKFQNAWDNVSKTIKIQYRTLKKLGSTDGRHKELRTAMRRAQSPLVPYLAITLNELITLSQALATHVEKDLINFTKMRRFTKISTTALQYQKDPYNFTYIPEVTKILLCTELPGDQDALYKFVDSIIEKPTLSLMQVLQIIQ